MNSKDEQITFGTGADEGWPEEPSFKDIVIFYNYVFDLGRNVNPMEAARKLLDTDFALSATNYLTDEIEVPNRFKKTRGALQDARWFLEFNRLNETGGFKAIAGFILKHPIRAFRMRKMYRLTINRESKNTETGQFARDQQEIIQELFESANSEIAESIEEAQAFLGLLMRSDKLFFSQSYISFGPFSRVELQPFQAVIEGKESSIKASILIHRSGTAILTFYYLVDGEKTVDQVLKQRRAQQVEISQTILLKAIVEFQQSASGINLSDLKEAKEIEWITFENQSEVTLATVFDAYQRAITCTILNKLPTNSNEPRVWLRTPDWLLYPIVFIRQVTPRVLSGESFEKNYRQALAGLVSTFEKWKDMKAEHIDKILANDSSPVSNHSFYISEGSATVIYYDSYRSELMNTYGEEVPVHEWFFDHFQKSSLVDVLLIQRGILNLLSEQVRNITKSMKQLNSIKQDLIFSLDEYHSMTVSHGSAQDIINASRQVMRIDDAYTELMFKLSTVDKLIDVEESRHRYMRDVTLRLATIAVTLLFGLVGSNQVVSIISSWIIPSTSCMPHWLMTSCQAFLDSVRAHPVVATLCLYGSVVAIIIPSMIRNLFGMRGRKPIVSFDQSGPANESGFTWRVVAPQEESGNATPSNKTRRGD